LNKGEIKKGCRGGKVKKFCKILKLFGMYNLEFFLGYGRQSKIHPGHTQGTINDVFNLIVNLEFYK